MAVRGEVLGQNNREVRTETVPIETKPTRVVGEEGGRASVDTLLHSHSFAALWRGAVPYLVEALEVERWLSVFADAHESREADRGQVADGHLEALTTMTTIMTFASHDRHHDSNPKTYQRPKNMRTNRRALHKSSQNSQQRGTSQNTDEGI